MPNEIALRSRMEHEALRKLGVELDHDQTHG
jgi:hypothetical protein